jgi:protease-4
MALDADLWLDRRRLKRRLALWRTAAVLAIAGLVFLAAHRMGVLPGEDHVARLTVAGVILEDPDRDDALFELAMDASAQALIVRIDSPGGTVVGGETLYRSLREVAKHKPVVAVMGTTATSAAYMAALGADHVIAHDGTLTGSIGVLLQSADVTGLLQKLGVSTEAIKSGPLKAVPSPFEKLTREGRDSAQAVVMDMHAFFVDLLAERRGLERSQALNLADGRVYTGRQALKARLVDAIGTEQNALSWLESERGVARTLPVKELSLGYEGEWLSGGLTGLFRKTKVLERLTLDGLVSLWHFELIRP